MTNKSVQHLRSTSMSNFTPSLPTMELSSKFIFGDESIRNFILNTRGANGEMLIYGHEPSSTPA